MRLVRKPWEVEGLSSSLTGELETKSANGTGFRASPADVRRSGTRARKGLPATLRAFRAVLRFPVIRTAVQFTSVLLPLALLTAADASSGSPQDGSSQEGAEFADLDLTLNVDAIEELESSPGVGEQHRGRWTGKLDEWAVEIDLLSFAREAMRLDTPEDVVRLDELHRATQDRAADRPPFVFETKRGLAGAFGWVPYAWVGYADRMEGTKAVGTYVALGGVGETAAYLLRVECTPALSDRDRQELEELLVELVDYTGSAYEPTWTDAEVDERWESDAPDSVLEDSKRQVVRTDYYVIMTNVGKGTARGFGKKIDECYEEIREVYPFEDVEGRRLLPIFYFVTPDQYYEWCVKNLGWEVEAARRSKGVATKDVYATYHQATNDPVHIHEATHQIFSQRLGLVGGGSWFQEGVAEYMSDTPVELGIFKNIAKDALEWLEDGEELDDGAYVPLEKFVVLPSLLYSSEKSRKTGGSAAGDAYDQAAAIVEFVRHGDFCEGKFLPFVHAIGGVARGDKPEIEKAFRRVFGVGLDEFEREFLEYWAKRKKPRSK